MVGNTLAFVYNSSLFQIAALMLLLSIKRWDRTLYRFLYAGVISLLLTVSIWAIAPSFGPGLKETIPADAASQFNLIVHDRFQALMNRLILEGPTTIPTTETVGLVAFPSFHTVMSLLVVFYSRKTALFWPVAVLNVLMIPAILGQGAHYVIDVVAGAVVFAIGAWAAAKLIRGPEQWKPVQALASDRNGA